MKWGSLVFMRGWCTVSINEPNKLNFSLTCVNAREEGAEAFQ
jgi:hypothetical protein